MSAAAGSGVRGVSIDATGTLFHCPRLGELYSETLGRHGVSISPESCATQFRHAWLEFECRSDPSRDRWARHRGGAQGWWSELIRRVCSLADAPEPTEFAVLELFHRFTLREAWEVYPDALVFLENLRERGLPCVVTSNWDHRLHQVIANLELAPYLRGVVCSEDVGAAKPAPPIFERTRALLEEAGASGDELLHIGDDGLCDVEGSEANGFEGMLLDRSKGTLTDLLERFDH
ncbi:MAG: HAD family hydrolase [Acidobacteriota bacterium]